MPCTANAPGSIISVLIPCGEDSGGGGSWMRKDPKERGRKVRVSTSRNASWTRYGWDGWDGGCWKEAREDVSVSNMRARIGCRFFSSSLEGWR